MTAALQSLVHSPKTRIGAEIFWYYNLGKAYLVGRIVKLASGSAFQLADSCAGNPTIPTTHFLSARVAKFEGSTDLVIEDAGGSNVDITIPAGSPVGFAIECKNPIPDLDPLSSFTGYTMTGGQAGDTVELWALPDPGEDILICYDQGVTVNPGTTIKAIRRKNNPADHFVNQIGENTVTVRELHVSNGVGLAAVRGRDVTLISKVFPDNAGSPSQIEYYTNCRFSPSKETPEDVNASVTQTSTGNFNADLNFTAAVS